MTVVKAENDLFECMRYIEVNPVRAGMAGHLRAYRWSSYGVNGEGKADLMASPHRLYRSLAREEKARRAAYLELFKEPMAMESLGQFATARTRAGRWGAGGFKRR